MEIAARFPSSTSLHHQCSTNKFSSPTSQHFSTDDLGTLTFDDLLDSFRNDYLAEWAEDDIKDVLNNIFEKETADLILKDILFIRGEDRSCWGGLMKKAYNNGYDSKNDGIDLIDWETVLYASFNDIKQCIKKRGEQCKLAFRILVC